MNFLSAYAADYRSGDERQKCAGTVDIFAQGVEPLADGFACAEVDALENCLFARHPEEHDGCKQCAEGADVNGHDIHPLRDYRLYAQCNGKTDDMDYGCCGYASELKLLLQERNGRFVEVIIDDTPAKVTHRKNTIPTILPPAMPFMTLTR